MSNIASDSRKGNKKARLIHYYGDDQVLRPCIVADQADDPEVIYQCTKIVSRENLKWRDPVRAAIWKAIWAHVSEHGAAIDLPTLKEAFAKDSPESFDADFVAGRKLQGAGSTRYQTGILRTHLEHLHHIAQEAEQMEATKIYARIGSAKSSDDAVNVGGKMLWGLRDAAEYFAAEKARIWGSDAGASEAKPATADAPKDLPNFPILIVTATGKMPAPRRVENTKAMLEFHNITVKYNVMTRTREITIPEFPSACSDTSANTALAFVHELAAKYGLQPSTEGLERHLALLQSHCHPVADWIRSKPWDGTFRVGDLMDTLEINHPEGRDAEKDKNMMFRLLQKWLLGGAKSALQPLSAKQGVKVQGMLVFPGLQGKAKTRWFESLVPEDSGWFLDGVRLDPDDKDSVAKATSRWLIELGELDATFRRTDISAIKGYLTSGQDVYRAPYDRCNETHIRRTIYCGTVNDMRYLRDDTGSRRFWTIPVTQVHPEMVEKIDLQQLWAQAASWVDAGEQHWPEKDLEAWLNDWNLTFEEQSPAVLAFIAQWKKDPMKRSDMTAKKVGNNTIRESLSQTFGKVGRSEMASITTYMRRVWGLQPRLLHGVDQWEIMPKTQQTDAAGTLIDAAHRFQNADLDEAVKDL